MFDKYILVSDGLSNVVESGIVTGFSVKVRIAYYRGLALSMIEGFDISVDGHTFPREANLFTVGGKTWTYAQMATEYIARWEMIEDAIVTVPHPGGLMPGAHQVRIVEFLRVSYVPTTVTGMDSKYLVATA
jgi:hypothetical protein